jgi:hypothetical protein
MFKIQMIETRKSLKILNLNLEFVSDFDIRISDFDG